MNAGEVKEKAADLGADIVGIGDMSLFEGTPPENDPRQIAPAAKSIIALGFRVLRGCFRGVESGTQFYQLPAMGVAHIDIRYAPHVLRRLACYIEDNGFEGCVLAPELDRLPKGTYRTNPEMESVARTSARPVGPGKAAPDVLINHDHAAFICGLGEMGMGGFLLTPEFGPLQRFAFILTDAELEFDAPYSGPRLCDECGLCVEACPGNAISADSETLRSWAGRSIRHKEVDSHQCSAYLSGADVKNNPFIPDDIAADNPELKELLNPKRRLSPAETAKVKELTLSYYGGVGGGYGPAMCGMACKRECVIHLQEKGSLTKTFVNPFRSGKPWYK